MILEIICFFLKNFQISLKKFKEGKKIKNHKQLILLVLAFAFVITICGTSAAATPLQNSTISHNNTTTNSTLQLTSKATTTKKAGSAGDPIITGTVKLNKYINRTLYNLQGATITINSTGINSRNDYNRSKRELLYKLLL